MNSVSRIVLAVALIVSAALFAMRPVDAQTVVPFVVLSPVATSAANCAWPTTATVTNGMALCATSSGLYYSLNGSATFLPVAGTQAAGVTSFNGRTGAVTLSKTDVLGTNFSIATTVTSTASSAAQ